jgi:hypothetical protein
LTIQPGSPIDEGAGDDQRIAFGEVTDLDIELETRTPGPAPRLEEKAADPVRGHQDLGGQPTGAKTPARMRAEAFGRDPHAVIDQNLGGTRGAVEGAAKGDSRLLAHEVGEDVCGKPLPPRLSLRIRRGLELVR